MGIFAPFSFLEVDVFDSDAQAFIDAAALTDRIEKLAINQFVVQLKAQSLWTKMQLIYPLIGGTSTTMKWNLKDPRDLNAAYRATFVNGGTFSDSGYTTNGTSNYLNTNMIGTAIGTGAGDFHLSIYADGLIGESGFDFGCRNNTQWLAGNLRNPNNQYNGRAFNNTNYSSAIDSQTQTQGFYSIGRTTTANYRIGFDGAYVTGSEAVTARPSYNLYFGGYNDYGTAGQFQARTYQTMTVGTGLTD